MVWCDDRGGVVGFRTDDLIFNCAHKMFSCSDMNDIFYVMYPVRSDQKIIKPVSLYSDMTHD